MQHFPQFWPCNLYQGQGVKDQGQDEGRKFKRLNIPKGKANKIGLAVMAKG